MDQQISEKIQKLRAWLFLRELLRRLVSLEAIGFALAAGMHLLACLVPWYGVSEWAAGILAAGALMALLISICKLPSKERAARTIDACGLQERTLTALELCGRDDLFARLQKADALEHLGKISFHKQLPLAVSRKELTALVAFAFFMVLCMCIPTASKETALSRHQLSMQIAQQVKQVEKAGEKLAENEDLSQEEAASLEALLEEIRKELSEAGNEEELGKALERAGLKLQQKAAELTDQESQRQVLQLAVDLSGNETKANPQLPNGTKTLQAAEDLAEELADAMEQEAGQTGLDEIQLSALSEKLSQLQEALSEEGLAESLSEEQLQSLEDLKEALADGSLSVSQLKAASSAAAQASSAATAALAGADGGENQNSSAAGQNGTGNHSESTASVEGTSAAGNSESESAGNGEGNGNGTADGQGSGSGNGGVSGGHGGGENSGSNEGLEKEASYNGELVSVPQEAGQDGNLTGKAGEGTTYTESGAAVTWSGNSVSYDRVVGQYSSKAVADLDNSDYPEGLKSVIRNYFSAIQ